MNSQDNIEQSQKLQESQPQANQIRVGQILQGQSVQSLPDRLEQWVGNSADFFIEDPTLEQKLEMYKKWKKQKQLTIWFEDRYQEEQIELQLNNLNFLGRINFQIQKCCARIYANWFGFGFITLFLAFIFYLIQYNKNVGKE